MLMKKMLWYSDFLCPTGFGNVAEELVSRLKNTYDITVLGVNYHGEPYNIPKSRYYHLRDIPVYPARYENDLLGRQKFLNILKGTDFDIVFLLQDTFNLVELVEPIKEARKDKTFKYVLYFPVDADLDLEWVQAVAQADAPVTYTRYGQEKVKEHGYDVPYIYHGVNTEVFYPLTEAERTVFRKHYMKAGPEDFIVTNVNRNQPRKDLPRTLLAFLKIKERIPTARLYLHTRANDFFGNNLQKFIERHIPRDIQSSIAMPEPEVMNKLGVPHEIMRRIYGCSDVVISTSRGEGWGLSTTEAMACKIPVVMPRHTSLVEIVGNKQERGLLVDSNDVDVNVRDNERIRPIVDIMHLTHQVYQVYTHPELARRTAEVAYTWVHEHCNWDKITAQWEEILGAEKVSTGR